jgi:sugar phosphate isomerase/epimerase
MVVSPQCDSDQLPISTESLIMSIRSCVTISLVAEARGGPFVFWDDLEASCRKAKALGFDAVEIFPPGPDAIDRKVLRTLLDNEGLSLAAIGTGAGWVKHKLHLNLPEAADRNKAKDFIRSIIDFAGQFEASAIIGSMQGRSGPGLDISTARAQLGEALFELGNHAKTYGVPLIYEPLNRYETDLVNTVESGVQLLESIKADNVVLLADLFHMNIEETNIADALRLGGKHVGHVHFVDSNRRAAGFGHTEFEPIIDALNEIGYVKYLSVEAFALPDSESAAKQTILAFQQLVK